MIDLAVVSRPGGSVCLVAIGSFDSFVVHLLPILPFVTFVSLYIERNVGRFNVPELNTQIIGFFSQFIYSSIMIFSQSPFF